LFPEAQQTIPESRRRGTDAFLVVWLQVTEKHYLLPIPSTLQRRLLDDLDMVEEHKLLPLPRDPSFEHVLQRVEAAMLAGKVAPPPPHCCPYPCPYCTLPLLTLPRRQARGRLPRASRSDGGNRRGQAVRRAPRARPTPPRAAAAARKPVLLRPEAGPPMLLRAGPRGGPRRARGVLRRAPRLL